MDFSSIDVVEVLDYYSIRNVHETGVEVQFSCPFPEHPRGDQNPSASINQENGLWHCFGCGRSGNIANFVADYEGISVAIAMRWLRENYFLGQKDNVSVTGILENLVNKRTKKSAPISVPIDEKYLKLFAIDWRKVEQSSNPPSPLLFPSRKYGLSIGTLEQFQIGFDLRTKRITIPIRNIDGKLVGFKGRCTDNHDAKYLTLGDRPEHPFPRYQSKHIVFGLFSADKDVIICEGEFDAISLRQKQFKGSVAFGTSDITNHQIKQIKENANRATILFDPDDAGRKGAAKVAKVLVPHLPVRIAQGLKNDPAASSREEIELALTNAQIPTNKH